MGAALKSFCSHAVARRHYDLSRYRIEPKSLEIEAFYRRLMA
jgi:hypothetical protein